MDNGIPSVIAINKYKIIIRGYLAPYCFIKEKGITYYYETA